jgi:hypothetical protein
MTSAIRHYLARIGSRGGRKSRRQLDAEQARAMVRVREARRAYRAFHAQCFWSSPPDLEITAADVDWVAERLMRHGGLRAWQKGASLCR